MQSKKEYEFMAVQLDSMRLCIDLQANEAMHGNDAEAYYTLDALRLELNTCIRRVNALAKLVDQRAKITLGDDDNGDV